MTSYKHHFTAFIESVCNKFNCPDMAPALKEGFQAFCEAIGEPSAETELVERIRAAEAETGASVPGIDSIVENIQHGHVRFTEGRTSIVLAPREYENDSPLYSEFASAALKHGIRVSFNQSNKFGQKMTLIWGDSPDYNKINYSPSQVGEISSDTELVERIRAIETDTGASVPGIDAIVENIQNGHAHWSDRQAGIVLPESDWEDNQMLFDIFAKKAAINGIKVSFRPSNKFGPIMTLSW